MDSNDEFRMLESMIQKSEDDLKKRTRKKSTDSNNNSNQMEFIQNIIAKELKSNPDLMLNDRDELVKKICRRLHQAIENNDELKRSELFLAQELQDMRLEIQEFNSMVQNKKQQNHSKQNGHHHDVSGSDVEDPGTLALADESSLELCRRQILNQSSFLSHFDYNHIDECDKSGPALLLDDSTVANGQTAAAATTVQMLIRQIKTLETKIHTERQSYLEENERLNAIIDEKQRQLDELELAKSAPPPPSAVKQTCDPDDSVIQGLFDWRIEDLACDQLLFSNDNHHQEQDSPHALENNCGGNLYQTNNRLLAVLSDLVKTFLDTENDIQKHLESLGLDRDNGLPTNNAEELLGYPSLEDDVRASDSIMLLEDGPDLMATPSSTTVTSAVNQTAGNDIEDDVVLGASRRLRVAVERVLKILGDTMDHQKQDYHELLKQREDLRLELQEENRRSDQLTRKLLERETTVKCLEQEQKTLSEQLTDYNEVKNQFQAAQRKLEEYERERDRFISENKRLEMERKSFDQGLPQLHQKILQENENLNKDIRQLQQEKRNLIQKINNLTSEVESLKSEKEQLIDAKNLEFEELLSQIEAREKNLGSLKRFIEEQTQEREIEREEFTKEVNALKEKLKEQEKQENRLKSNVRSLENQISAINEEKSAKDDQLEEMEKNLKEANTRMAETNRTRRQIESELERNARMENELRNRLKKVSNVLQVKLNDETNWDDLLNAIDLLVSNGGGGGKTHAATLLTSTREKRRLEGDKCDLDTSIFATIKMLDDKVKQLNQNVDSLTGRNEQLKTELKEKNELIAKLEQFKAKMETMDQNLKELTKTNELLQQEINASHMKCSELKVKLESSVDVQEFKRVVAELQNKLNNEKQQSEAVAMKLEQANRHCNELTEKLDAYKKEIRSFKELLKSGVRDDHTVSGAGGASPTSTSSNKRQSKDLGAEMISQLNSKLEIKDRTISLLEQNIEILKSKLESVTGERDIYAERVKLLDESRSKVTVYEKNLEKLRLQNKISSDKITYLELETRNLKQKIVLLEKENEALRLENKKLLRQNHRQEELNAAAIFELNEPDAVAGNPQAYLNGFDKMNHMTSNNMVMLKVRRLLTQKNALIYQKNYLIHVLGTYQRTETDTLALLAHINNTKDAEDEDAKMRGKARFRSVVYALIALRRMKYMVNIWECRRRQLMFHKTANSIATLQNVPMPPRIPKASGSGRQIGTEKNQSHPHHHYHLLKHPTTANINSTMKDYVDRLHVVHETLGLNTNKRL